MARAIYSTKLYEAIGLANTIFEVTNDTPDTWVIRQSAVYADTALTGEVRYYLRGNAGQTLLFHSWNPTDEASFLDELRYVIRPGEHFSVESANDGSGGAIDVYVGGYSLSP